MTDRRHPDILVNPPSRIEGERLESLLRHENAFLRAKLENAAMDVRKEAAKEIEAARGVIAHKDAEIEALRQAESDVSYLLYRLGKTPLAFVFRRWPGYRVLEERWTQ